MNACFESWNPHFQEYFGETLEKLKVPGLLLVSKNNQESKNVMTIGWGLIGIFWEKPVFLISVRASSYTHELIENSGEFTINVPEDGMDDIVKYCGEVSGRERNKFSDCNLNLLEARILKTPIIAQCKLHYECRVLNVVDIVPRPNIVKFILRVINTKVKRALRLHNDYRSLYFGEILAVY